MILHFWEQVGKYGPGQPVDFGADRVTRSVSESLERLDVDYIDVILVHDVEYADDLQQVIDQHFALFHNGIANAHHVQCF